MSEQLFLEAFNSEPYFFEKEEKYGAMDIIYTFEDEAGHGFKFHFEKKVALGKHAYVCVLSQKTPGLKTYKRVIGKFSNPMRTVATLLAVVRDIHDTRKDVHGIVMSIPEQAFGSYSRLVKKIMTRELRTVLNVEDGDYTPEDFEKMGLVGIVTTVKPRNMNTVYTGPALKEYQERQAGKDGAGISTPTPAAVVPDVKAPVSKGLGSVGVSLTYSSDLANLEVNGDTEHGATIKSLVNAHLSALGNISGIGGKFLARVDRENEQQLFVSIKKLVEELTSLGANVVQNSNVKDAIYKAKMAAAKQSDASRNAKQQAVKKPDFAAPVQVIFNVHAPDGRTLTLTVDHLSGVSTKDFDGNFVSEKVFKNGDIRLIVTGMREYTNVAKLVPLIQMSLNDGFTVASVPQYRGKVASKGITELNNPDGPVDLPKQTSVAQTMPVVDPVAEKENFYFDYDHRQITLTFNDKETAGRIKDQLLELGAATFNDNEFFTDKEKLILVDGNALDVKKVQETLFPILGQPLMMNGVFVDPNVRSSVRSPDGVVYHIKGNTIQVEDAPKDSAAKIVGMVIPGVERIFDDKGNNTIELNAAGIADGHEMFNFVKVLKSISINEELSRYVFMDWDSIAGDAMDKYDLSTSSFKSLATNDGQYLINDSYAGLVAEYTKSAGNVINGVVFKSTYRASDRVTSLFSKDGYKVEHEVGGWGTQITIPLSSEFKLPAHDNLAKLIKELDNLSCFDRNRSIVEYVGGNRNFIAKFIPEDSRVGLRLPTDDAGYLAWSDYTSYTTAPNFIRFDGIETLDQFHALVAKVKDFDFGANLLRNIGASKYFADVRSGGPEAKKTYKLKEGGEVEITFEFGDKVFIAFSKDSEGFDKDLSEWADEKNEIFGRINAIQLFKLGTADANKTLKNIDAWLDAHIVSKEDNASSASLILNAGFSSGNDYSASVVGGVLQIHDQREGVVASLSGINLDGVPAVVLSGVELHIREPEFKKASFQGVVVDKAISTDNVKIVIKKSDGTLIGRIELNSSAETNNVSKEDNASKGDTFQVTLNGSGGEDDEYGVDDISVAITGSESVVSNMKAKLTPVIAKYNIEELKVMDGGKTLVAFFDKYSSNSTAKRFIDFVNSEFKGAKSGPVKKIKPPKIERKKVNDSEYSVLIDGVNEGRITKTTSKGKATWAIYHDKSGIQIYGYLSAPTLFDDFKKQYLQWFEAQGKANPEPAGLQTKKAKDDDVAHLLVADNDPLVKADLSKLPRVYNSRSPLDIGKSFTIKFGNFAFSVVPKDKKILDNLRKDLKASGIVFEEASSGMIRFETTDGNRNKTSLWVNEFTSAAKSSGGANMSLGNYVFQREYNGHAAKDRAMREVLRDGYEAKVKPSQFVSQMNILGAGVYTWSSAGDERKDALKLKSNDWEKFINLYTGYKHVFESTQIDEDIKEDLTGKAPNRVKRELLEATLQKLGLYRESFTYGNATFKTVMTECAVEIIPTSGNIRNFAKMLGARLGQELRIDDEGFLSFDLDNI